MRKLFDIEVIAKICHAAACAWNESWEQPSTHFSVVCSSYGRMVEMFAIGCDEKYVHDCWVKTKIMEGWSYSATRDSVKKTDPYLLPYEELSLQLRLKYTLFKNIVIAFDEARIQGV